MATQLVEANESPLRKFDEQTLKAMGSREVDAGAPRAMFLPANMGEAMELAKLMAAGNFVPPHLRGKPGDCLAVVMQATRWALDPFAVGNKTYFVNDRMAYEAQLVTAVINSSHVLDGRLHPEWEGEGNELVCTITGKVKGDPEPKRRRVPIKNITTRNSPLWKQDPEQQLAYYAMRAWVRLHAPEVLLGVYTPDELAEARAIDGGDIASAPLTASMITDQAKPVEAADPETGEVTTDSRGMTEVDEEAARKLDAGEPTEDADPDPELDPTPNVNDDAQTEPEAESGEPDGAAPAADEPTLAEQAVAAARAGVNAAKSATYLKAVDDKWQLAKAAVDDATAAEIDGLIAARRKALAGEGE